MLKSLGVRNLKGLSGDWKFGSRTVITGEDNGVGKTALLQAVMLDMFGHLPELGRRPIDTLDLSSGEVMVVMSAHDGWTATQKWGKKYDAKFDPEGHLHLPVEMVSLGNFFKQTSVDRSRALLRCCKNQPQPLEVFLKIKNGLLSLGLGPDDLKLVEDYSPEKLQVENKQDWLNQVVDVAKTDASNLRTQIRGAKGATSELVSQTSAAPVEQAVRNLQPEIDEKNKLLADFQKSITDLQLLRQSATDRLEAIVTNGKTLKAEIEQLTVSPKTPKCTNCGGEVACPTCAAANPQKQNDALLATKGAELKQLRLDARKEQQEIERLTVDIQTLNTSSVANVQQELSELNQRQALWHQSQGKQVAADDASAKIVAQEHQLEVVMKFAERAAETIQQILTQSMGEALKVANRLVRPVLGFDLEYQGDRFGYQRRGRFVGYATLSGSERAVMTAGIGMALTADSPEKILLIDELATMKVATKKRFIDTVSELIQEGVIHQMIATTPSISKQELAYYEQIGVQVIDLKERQP